MINMSFYDGTMNKKELIDFIESTDKDIIYTHGLKFRRPTTYEVPIDKQRALEIINNYSLLGAREKETYIELNTYSGNDMW